MTILDDSIGKHPSAVGLYIRGPEQQLQRKINIYKRQQQGTTTSVSSVESRKTYPPTTMYVAR